MDCTKQYALSPVFEEVLAHQCGLEQQPFSDTNLAQLARNVKKIADAYTEGQPLDTLFSDPAVRMAYSAYYLPCNAIKLFPILNELERRKALPPLKGTLRVLDLGCGPGTLLAGLLDYCLQHDDNTDFRLDLTGIDRDPGNCSAARALIEAFFTKAPDVHSARFLTGDMRNLSKLTSASPQKGFDLIMAGNLVNELHGDALADFARRTTALLNPTGIMIILDPGTRKSFKNLLLLREELLIRNNMHLAAPCLQADTCPLQHCEEAWCHEKLFWTPPRLVSLIDQRTGFTKHKGVKFSYLAVTPQPQSPAAEQDEDLWRVTSYVIRNKGQERLYVCNGRERRLLRRLTRISGEASTDFSNAKRGDIVTIKAAEPRNDFMNIGPETIFKKVF
jgi:ribosomal protein RSM22 (predicted rRNA methylase)